MRIALITGASSGIGEAFCRELDRRGLDCIWMVARRADALERIGASLSTPCRVIPADLSTADGVGIVTGLLESERPEVAFLVNCAGFGRFGDTCDIPSEDISDMISVNCTALSVITARCIPFMGSGSHIIQVCSASAYLPLSHLNVYAATKAYVRSFCGGLRRELRGTGISVLEVSPGWVDTGFIDAATQSHGVPAKVFRHTVTRDQVVSRAMSDLGRRRSVCGSYNRLQVFVCTHLPSVASWVWERSLRRRHGYQEDGGLRHPGDRPYGGSRLGDGLLRA